MLMKMQGLEPQAEVFARFYQMHIVTKELCGADGKVLGCPSIGSCTFVPGIPQIAPFCKNKWNNYTECWFYYRVATDEQLVTALAVGKARASVLCSMIASFEGYVKLEYVVKSEVALRVCQAFESAC